MLINRQFLSTLLLLPLATATACGSETTNRERSNPPAGINLSVVADYSTEVCFADLFKSSRWIAQGEGRAWGEGEELQWTADGHWIQRLKPSQYATALMCESGGQIAGRYICLYDGEGRIDFEGNAHIVKEQPGRIELDVTYEDMMLLHLRRTNPNNPVRNMRVVPADHEQSIRETPFFQPFLHRCENFQVIRFMDWMKTNDSPIQHWEDRPRITDPTQADRGVALEYMVELCNQVRADPWFCIPHRADDNYVRQFATQVRDTLDSGRTVYVEYSNEVWNSAFPQAHYAREQGMRRELSDNEYEAQILYYSERSVEIFRIWEAVFGQTDRLVRVLGSHAQNPWATYQIAGHKSAYRHADAIAIAPYFGCELGHPDQAEETAKLSVDGILRKCRKEIRENHKLTREVVQFAKQRNLDVIAYEGGQHLVGFWGTENHRQLTLLFQSANRDPRMKDLYLEDLREWRNAGGGLFVFYASMAAPGKWGSWGLLESEAQNPATAPKFQAVLEFIKGGTRPLLGSESPNVVFPKAQVSLRR